MLAKPTRFGPYELERRLGAGGMAETFIAVRRGPGGFEQHVCLKRILPAFEEDVEFVRLFLEEARIAAKLRHANIVQVLDFGVVEGSHFMTLELIDGLDLRQLISRVAKSGEAITSGIVSHLAFELGSALDFAHAEQGTRIGGVVHRDISPSNVLLSTAGEVKLADFGIAKAASETSVTQSGVVKGKVPYMAPEYALTGQCDRRSDLFSLGVTLYEALCGERPFDGRTDLDTLRRIQEGEYVPLGDRMPAAPKQLVSSVEKLLCTDPDERFDSAASFLDALLDVAPPPTARRILGELVREQARDRTAPPGVDVGHANTLRGTPQGTAILEDEHKPAEGDIKAAAPSDETRTRASEHPPAPPPDEAQSAHHTPGQAPEPSGSVAGQDPLFAPSEGDAVVRHDDPPEGRTVAEAAGHGAAATEPLPATADVGDGVSPTGRDAAPRRIPRSLFALPLLAVAAIAAGVLLKTPQEGVTERPDVANGAAARGRNPIPANTPDRPTAQTALPTLTDPAPAAPPSGQQAGQDQAGHDRAGQADEGEPGTSAGSARPLPPAAQAAETATTGPESTPTGHEARARKARRARPARPASPPATPTDQPPAEGRATLNVVVFPFGDVWVDRRRVGPSPVTVELSPGRHEVSAGDGSPTKRTTVDLRPGQRRQVVIR